MDKPSSLRQFGLLILVLLLAFAQQAGSVHALSHLRAAESSRQSKHPPIEKACDKCLAFASLDGIVEGHDAKPPTPPSYDVFISTDGTRAAVAVVTPYLTRAPPRLS